MKRLIILGMMCAPVWAQQGDKLASANADLIAARSANTQMRYADAEALMLKATAADPRASLMWLELGSSQLGLKKYPEAERAFQKAIGIDPETQAAMRGEDFYAPQDPGVTHVTRNVVRHTVISDQNLSPEIVGAAYSGLGEVYARSKRTADAQTAWDAAVKANPAKAPLYLGNEASIFYQEGNADAQAAAAEKAIAVGPGRAILYYFKAQGLASKATIDPQTQKMVLPPGCLEAYRKYLQLDPKGQFSADAKEMIAAAGTS